MKTKITRRGIVRQGDVLLIPVDAVDATLTVVAPKDPRGLVLAEGETSGHDHRVFGRGAKLFHFRDTRSDRVLVVGRSGADVRVVGGGSGGVDRHTPISLLAGAYLVRVQKQWTAADERASNVCD